ncbi:MAG: hypothetical protein NZM12_03550 [Steroidobacteraceae bacterium]|nr:hypothetical protein [Steroidobacteraceae bacterium]MDW8259024.1 hypothetical protein [Gammaproteobacteria bacterium]
MATPTTAAADQPVAKPGGGALAPVHYTREQIDIEQVLERYLTGQLDLRQQLGFEEFCRRNPQYLEEMRLSRKMQAGLRLLDAAGRPEPWNEDKHYFWLTHWFAGAAAGLAALLFVTTVVFYSKSALFERQLAKAEQQLRDQPLLPASTSRSVQLVPSAKPSPRNPTIAIGNGARAEYVTFKFDLSRSDYQLFDFEIERVDQGRVAQLFNVRKDSNGIVSWAINSSTLGPGVYTIAIDGRNWRGQRIPLAGASFEVLPRR